MNKKSYTNILIIIILSFPTSANAEIIFESATGPFDSTTGGSVISKDQFLGMVFSIKNRVKINGIGGHFFKYDGDDLQGEIFGAIVNLNEDGLPTGTLDYLENVVAHKIFEPTAGKDFVVEISATLEPGNYGIVFGSGLWDTTGKQGLTLVQPCEPFTSNGNGIFIMGDTDKWRFKIPIPKTCDWEKNPKTRPNRHRIIIVGEPDY